MSSNPFQPFFDKLDKTVEGLAGLDAVADRQTMAVVDPAIDLLKRAGFVLANLLNAQAQLYPHIMLDPESETIEGAVESAPDQPEQPESHVG